MGKTPGRIWIGTPRRCETGQEEAAYQPGRTAKHHRGNETALEVAASISEVSGEVNGSGLQITFASCADGIQALRHYRYEIEEAKSDPAGGHLALSKVARHDWASHSADAFRTAVAMSREPEKKKETEKLAKEMPVLPAHSFAGSVAKSGCPATVQLGFFLLAPGRLPPLGTGGGGE